MNCQDRKKISDAFIDRELDPIASLEFEEHLSHCATCERELESEKEFAKFLRASSSELSFKPHPEFEKKLLREIRKQKSRRTFQENRWSRFLKAAVVLIIPAFIWLAYSSIRRSPDLGADEMISAHIRSTLAEHLVDVHSSDQHTVKPWFAGKVDFSPPVFDFSSEGFPLIGGRLEYLHHHSAIALVYQRRKHLINLFVESASHSDQPQYQIRKSGYGVIHWKGGDFSYSAVSDLNEQELENFVQLVQKQNSAH